MAGGVIARRALEAIARLSACVAAGVALGGAAWAVAMMLNGHGLVAAASGQVEDGLGLLQGLATLGGMCGAGIGLAWGALALTRGPDAEPISTPDRRA
jgi:hypothetical protein